MSIPSETIDEINGRFDSLLDSSERLIRFIRERNGNVVKCLEWEASCYDWLERCQKLVVRMRNDLNTVSASDLNGLLDEQDKRWSLMLAEAERVKHT